MLGLKYFYNFLYLTKIALLFRCLNIHLIRITLAQCGTLVREKLAPEKDEYYKGLRLCAIPAPPFRHQAFGLSFDQCGILP